MRKHEQKISNKKIDKIFLKGKKQNYQKKICFEGLSKFFLQTAFAGF